MEPILLILMLLLGFLSGWILRGGLHKREAYQNQIIGQLLLRAELSLNDIYRRRFFTWVEDPKTKTWAYKMQKKYGAVRLHSRDEQNGP